MEEEEKEKNLSHAPYPNPQATELLIREVDFPDFPKATWAEGNFVLGSDPQSGNAFART